MPTFVGRAEPLARLTASYRALAEPDSASPGPAGLVLVTGEAGIGKTALLTRFATQVAGQGATVVWGTCWDGDQAPAWWPWTQALRTVLDLRDGLADSARPELAAIVPELGPASTTADAGLASRVRVFDAAWRVLRRAAADTGLVVVLDDLHWADQSTVDLLRFVAQQHQAGPLLLVGAYRPREPRPEIAAALSDLAIAADLVPLRGLSPSEVDDLVQSVTGAGALPPWARLVHERSGGHPFFARELCHLLVAAGPATGVPDAVREVIGRRLARLSVGCGALLDAAAVAVGTVLPDVLAEVTGDETTRVDELVGEAVAAGILTTSQGELQFVHDLYRETIYTGLSPERRLDLHHRTAVALAHRHERGSPVFPAEVARHFTAAVAAADTTTAVHWAYAAARTDATRFGFAEAAGHLTRLRAAVADAGLALSDADLIGLLTTEADLRLRAGEAAEARALLDTAWTRARTSGEPDLVGEVALGLDRVDARFAMPRTELLSALQAAQQALLGSGSATEAKVTAALARQRQHSVPADRTEARPLAERAVAIARTLDDPATLATCLLARHDTLWTPGTAAERAAVAAEIGALAVRAGDPERHAQALLLSATAQLESGSAAFRATLAEYEYLSKRLRQPRHDYLLRVRQAALMLLDGDIDAGDRLSAEAATLGQAVGDTDTGNVRMSQRLEIVRAHADPAELRDMADEAVRWWIGAPAHAHAVAAGFRARSGDLDGARREVDTVLALDDWHTDRSYLWSIFIGELATAAITLRDGPLCRRLLDDLLPVADTCAVNGALVCFMGAHAHRVGLLYDALDEVVLARQWLDRALAVHRRLGARVWQAETQQALATLGERDATEETDSASAGGPRLRRVGDLWEASFRGKSAFLRDAKGLHDLAALLDRPATDLPAIDLIGTQIRDQSGHSEPILDRTALLAYRRRLTELDDEIATADTASDPARRQRATDEREQLLTELRRATRPDGTSRTLGSTAAERARKAVTARIRDSIRHITVALPELGTHLDRSIRTGTTCRYDP